MLIENVWILSGPFKLGVSLLATTRSLGQPLCSPAVFQNNCRQFSWGLLEICVEAIRMMNLTIKRAVPDALDNKRSEMLDSLSDRFTDRLEISFSESVSQSSLSCACSLCKGVTFGSSSTPELSSSLGSNLNPDALVSSSFGDITKDYIDWDGGNTTLTYTVFDRESDNFIFTSLEQTPQEEALIDDTFAEVDALIELDFVESESLLDSEVVVIKVDRYIGWIKPSTVGQVVEGENRWFVLWKDTGDAEFDSNTIVHEIGHSLGLSHPNEDPNNPEWNTVEDTMMSYNSLSGEWGVEFTDVDLAALTGIWGVESDSV